MLLDLLSSLLAGGATGVIGASLGSVVEFFKQKQKNEHELALMQAERENMALEIQGRERVATIEAESAEAVEASKAFVASIAADRATYSDGRSALLVWVDVVRGMTRPVLTTLLVMLVCVMWFTTDNDQLRMQIVATVLYVTTAAVLWWFGSRVKQPK